MLAACGAADFAFFHVVTNVAFTQIVLQRDVRTRENQQQLGLIAVQALQSLIQGCEAGPGGAQRVESRLNVDFVLLSGRLLVGFQLGVQFPYFAAHRIERRALSLVEADQLDEDALSMDPTQGVRQHVELTGIVADDDQVAHGGVFKDAAQ